MKKKVFLILFLVLFMLGFFNFVFVDFMRTPFFLLTITGYAINNSGVVNVFIENFYNVRIHSPTNITYNFEKGAIYLIDLNVSADFVVDPVDGWKYSLYDSRHDVYVETDLLFTPNSSIDAVRWGNVLTVYALADGGEWHNSTVMFFVNVSNSAPLLGNITDPIFACEGERLRYSFNATDVDEDYLVGDISPKNPFYLNFIEHALNISFFEIVSGVLTKFDVGSYVEEISVMDIHNEVDTDTVNIEVIEINNLPTFEDIGAQTVWLSGNDSVFYKVFEVEDIEDGGNADGNLFFNLTWGEGENLFDIGYTNGTMNYTPVVGHEGRIYSLQVCVEDNALASAHDNISLCLGGAEENVVCDDFTLTVTDNNRAPEILSYAPDNITFSVSGTEPVNYFSEVYDSDGTIPDINWYIDGVNREHNEDISEDNFLFSFGCGVSGVHSVEVVTTDGLLNDSQEWLVNVINVECPSRASSGGGGGGSFTGYRCVENWACEEWQICQNVKRSFESGFLSIEDYSAAKSICLENGEEDERFCGFQIKKCNDLNDCNNENVIYDRPSEKRFCYFTENPSCYDDITNCHDGACELLVDCGGPCESCPTCSDGKQNQGEEGIDCGGPCPYSCEKEVPFAILSSVLTVVATTLVLVILFVSWRLFFLWRRNDGI